MEQPNIFNRKLVEKGITDILSNKWWVEHGVVNLKLVNEAYSRKLGIISGNRFIVYRNRAKHTFNKTNSYGFSSEVIEGLYKYVGIKFVDVYDDFGMYRLGIEVIQSGEFLFFKEQGFEKQLFVPLEEIEKYKVELEEDINRRNLLGDSWFNEVRAEFHKPYWTKLGQEVYRRRQITRVYPEKEDVFKAFKLTPYNEVKVVIIGQDPYHNGVADGLAFSSKDDLKMPPSLAKMYEAIEQDHRFGLYLGQNTSLEYWAEQGVLLLNTCLTVEEGNPNSHHGLGWEFFIERVLDVLKHHNHDLVFMLWGNNAKLLRHRVEDGRHLILEAEHPVMGAKEHRKWEHKECFKKCNVFLESKGYGEIDW